MSILEASDSNFADIVLKSDKPVIVDYWAEWCGPCKMIAPILEQADQEIGDKINIVKINIDENPNTPTQYGIRSIPTLMLFKNGETVDTKVGGMSKNQLIEWAEKHL